jgi:hypothetical protein
LFRTRLAGALIAAVLAAAPLLGGGDRSQDTAYFKSTAGLNSETEFASHTLPATDGLVLD